MESQKSILLLDDEFDIVTLFKNFLRKRGHSVFGFTDPVAALEHFRNNSTSYAVVISDVRMPIMNGFEFAREIKSIKHDVRIILMSAFEISEVEYSASLRSVKIDGFLRKPIEISSLARRIEEEMTS